MSFSLSTIQALFVVLFRVIIPLFICLQMEGQNWTETGNALLEIAEHALEQNVDEIDIMFFNSSLVFRGVKVRGPTLTAQ